jgi:DnaJ-class molecular chaperone
MSTRSGTAVCEQCHGKGAGLSSVIDDDIRSDYIWEVCDECGGSGTTTHQERPDDG